MFFFLRYNKNMQVGLSELFFGSSVPPSIQSKRGKSLQFFSLLFSPFLFSAASLHCLIQSLLNTCWCCYFWFYLCIEKASGSKYSVEYRVSCSTDLCFWFWELGGCSFVYENVVIDFAFSWLFSSLLLFSIFGGIIFDFSSKRVLASTVERYKWINRVWEISWVTALWS